MKYFKNKIKETEKSGQYSGCGMIEYIKYIRRDSSFNNSPYSAEIDLSRQNLTCVDVRKLIPAL